MKILSNVTMGGNVDMASSAKDTFTIGSELERDNPNADELNVWANTNLNNDVNLGSSSADIITAKGQLTASNGLSASIFYGDGSGLINVGAIQANGITIGETGSNAGSPILNVTTLKFDKDTGFNVENVGDNAVKISLGSSFKTWQVAGQDSLVASGEDTVEFIPGNNITITTNTGSSPKSITINSSASGSLIQREYELPFGKSIFIPLTGVAVKDERFNADITISSGTLEFPIDETSSLSLPFSAIVDINSSGILSLRATGVDFTNQLGPEGILPGVIIQGEYGVSISSDATRVDAISLESRGGIRLRLDEDENGQAGAIYLNTGPNTVTGTLADGPVNIALIQGPHTYVSESQDLGFQTINVQQAIYQLDSAILNLSQTLSNGNNNGGGGGGINSVYTLGDGQAIFTTIENGVANLKSLVGNNRVLLSSDQNSIYFDISSDYKLNSMNILSNTSSIDNNTNANVYYVYTFGDPNRIVTLPSAATQELKSFFIKNGSTDYPVTLMASGSETIDGANSVILNPLESIQIAYYLDGGGTAWKTLGNYLKPNTYESSYVFLENQTQYTMSNLSQDTTVYYLFNPRYTNVASVANGYFNNGIYRALSDLEFNVKLPSSENNLGKKITFVNATILTGSDPVIVDNFELNGLYSVHNVIFHTQSGDNFGHSKITENSEMIYPLLSTDYRNALGFNADVAYGGGNFITIQAVSSSFYGYTWIIRDRFIFVPHVPSEA